MKEPNEDPDEALPELQVFSAGGQSAPAPDWLAGGFEARGACLIGLDPADDIPADLIAYLAGRSLAVVLLGPSAGHAWRETAAAAGAFGCLSAAAAPEDKISLLQSAARYAAAQAQVRALRKHHDTLCTELVQSFGGAMEELSAARQDAGRFRDALQEIQLRLIRTLA